jgi:hypothetical protein
MWRRDAGNYVAKHCTITNSVCTPAKLPCRRVVYPITPQKLLKSLDLVVYIENG